eukprot:TRINITY_DN23551_c0_g1_i1.p1 TRINITY_DN23551_c0_g1~~TRINITY_DN23551_c0_g1_i1.p1  ORF type:complete len:849 (-),score=245.93 TRINITY_DN23551_c0_g1_i1:694-3240(-)
MEAVDDDENLLLFVALTQASKEDARATLQVFSGDLNAAVNFFMENGRAPLVEEPARQEHVAVDFTNGVNHYPPFQASAPSAALGDLGIPSAGVPVTGTVSGIDHLSQQALQSEGGPRTIPIEGNFFESQPVDIQRVSGPRRRGGISRGLEAAGTRADGTAPFVTHPRDVRNVDIEWEEGENGGTQMGGRFGPLAPQIEDVSGQDFAADEEGGGGRNMGHDAQPIMIVDEGNGDEEEQAQAEALRRRAAIAGEMEGPFYQNPAFPQTGGAEWGGAATWVQAEGAGEQEVGGLGPNGAGGAGWPDEDTRTMDERIEEEMIQAAIRASQDDARAVVDAQHRPENQQFQAPGVPQGGGADDEDEVARAMALSIQTAERESALREMAGESVLNGADAAFPTDMDMDMDAADVSPYARHPAHSLPPVPSPPVNFEDDEDEAEEAIAPSLARRRSSQPKQSVSVEAQRRPSPAEAAAPEAHWNATGTAAAPPAVDDSDADDEDYKVESEDEEEAAAAGDEPLQGGVPGGQGPQMPNGPSAAVFDRMAREGAGIGPGGRMGHEWGMGPQPEDQEQRLDADEIAGVTAEEQEEARMIEAVMLGVPYVPSQNYRANGAHHPGMGVPRGAGMMGMGAGEGGIGGSPPYGMGGELNGYDDEDEDGMEEIRRYAGGRRRPAAAPSEAVIEQRLLREQQDNEYQASLIADRERELLAQQEKAAALQAAEAEQERLRQEAAEQQKEAEELARLLKEKAARLPPEPLPGGGADGGAAPALGSVITVQVRMPDGSRRSRRFLKSDPLQALFDFVDVGSAVKPGSYRLIQSFPRRAFSESEGAEQQASLEAVGLTNRQEALMLELI